MGKAKPASHTSKELANKAKAATQNAGAGAAGKADRQGGKAGHAKMQCPICGQQAPGEKSANEHWEAKHKKLNGEFDIEKWTDMHQVHGGTTVGVAVQGSKKYGTEREKKEAEASGKVVGSKKAKGATKRGVS